MTDKPIAAGRAGVTRRSLLAAGLAMPALLPPRRAAAAGRLNITASDGFVPPGHVRPGADPNAKPPARRDVFIVRLRQEEAERKH